MGTLAPVLLLHYTTVSTIGGREKNRSQYGHMPTLAPVFLHYSFKEIHALVVEKKKKRFTSRNPIETVVWPRYKTYLIPGETLIPGKR